VFDRRRILLASQSFMLVGAATLGVLTRRHDVTPWCSRVTFAIARAGDDRPSGRPIQPEVVGAS